MEGVPQVGGLRQALPLHHEGLEGQARFRAHHLEISAACGITCDGHRYNAGFPIDKLWIIQMVNPVKIAFCIIQLPLLSLPGSAWFLWAIKD